MMEMIERVAAALEAAFEREGRVFDAGQADDLARAAIEAMREPSKEMVLSIAAADWRGASDLNWSEGWRIMIDAALKP